MRGVRHIAGHPLSDHSATTSTTTSTSVVHHGREEATVTTSVLRIADQRAGRFPDVCVLSGVATENAVRVQAVEWSGRSWILGIPGVVSVLRWWPGRSSETVALPVAATVWRMWNRRNTVAMALMMFGLGLVVIGAIRTRGAGVVIGVLRHRAGVCVPGARRRELLGDMSTRPESRLRDCPADTSFLRRPGPSALHPVDHLIT